MALIFLLFLLIVGGFGLSMHSSTSELESTHVAKVMAAAKLNGVAKPRCPSCATRDSPMPPFTALGAANLEKVALFLAASRAGP